MNIQKFNHVEANIFSFLASKNFTEILKKADIETEDHNFLLLAHLMALTYNTQGISSGGAFLSYSQNFGPTKEDFFRAHSGFHFFTTKNHLIEDSSACSNATIKISNEIFSTYNTRDFKRFCIEYYDKYSKKLPEKFFKNNQSKYSEIKFRFIVNGLKRWGLESQVNGYRQIIQNHDVVKAHTESLYLYLNMSNNVVVKNDTTKTRIKI